MRSLCVLAVAVATCTAAAGAVAQAPAFPVRHTLVVATSAEWQHTPWYRVSDAFSNGPVYAVITHGDRACVVPPEVWASVLVGELHECRTGWRLPRPRTVPAMLPRRGDGTG